MWKENQNKFSLHGDNNDGTLLHMNTGLYAIDFCLKAFSHLSYAKRSQAYKLLFLS